METFSIHMKPKYPVRILPMNREEHGHVSTKRLQQKFFLRDLAHRPRGYYYRKKRGLKARAGAIVLFQYRAKIVGLAELTGFKKFDEPKGEYHGKYYFRPRSIRVFAPVSQEQFSEFWPGKRFS